MRATVKSVTLDIRPVIGWDRDFDQSQVRYLGQTHTEYQPEQVWCAPYVTEDSVQELDLLDQIMICWLHIYHQ